MNDGWFSLKPISDSSKENNVPQWNGKDGGGTMACPVMPGVGLCSQNTGLMNVSLVFWMGGVISRGVSNWLSH